MQYNDIPSIQTYQTRDYDRFNIRMGQDNRKVDDKDVNKVIKSIELYGDQGKFFPIVVDDKWNIIDGQHRFLARKQTGRVIYYIQSLELDARVLGGINDAMKKWSRNDFVEVAHESEIAITIEEIRAEINWVGLSYSALALTLGINLKLILSDNTKLREREYNKLLGKKESFIIYMKDLTTKMTDKDTFYTRTSRYETVCNFAKKLQRYKINLSDIPVGTFDVIQTHLIGKGLLPS